MRRVHTFPVTGGMVLVLPIKRLKSTTKQVYGRVKKSSEHILDAFINQLLKNPRLLFSIYLPYPLDLSRNRCYLSSLPSLFIQFTK